LAVCLFADRESPTHTHSSQKEIIKTGTRLFFLLPFFSFQTTWRTEGGDWAVGVELWN
jgi:predicted small integral membrane protein